MDIKIYINKKEEVVTIPECAGSHLMQDLFNGRCVSLPGSRGDVFESIEAIYRNIKIELFTKGKSIDQWKIVSEENGENWLVSIGIIEDQEIFVKCLDGVYKSVSLKNII